MYPCALFLASANRIFTCGGAGGSLRANEGFLRGTLPFWNWSKEAICSLKNLQPLSDIWAAESDSGVRFDLQLQLAANLWPNFIIFPSHFIGFSFGRWARFWLLPFLVLSLPSLGPRLNHKGRSNGPGVPPLPRQTQGKGAFIEPKFLL